MHHKLPQASSIGQPESAFQVFVQGVHTEPTLFHKSRGLWDVAACGNENQWFLAE